MQHSVDKPKQRASLFSRVIRDMWSMFFSPIIAGIVSGGAGTLGVILSRQLWAKFLEWKRSEVRSAPAVAAA